MTQPQAKSYLFVDLTRRQADCLEISAEVLREYPSGTALATYLLQAHLEPGADPLAPGSVMVMANGLLGGLPYPGATRMALAAKSPVTGLWAGGTMGGEFAWALCRTEWAAVVISGQAAEDTYLLIDEGRVYFRSAADLAGQSPGLTIENLKQAWGRESVVLAIGQAGEAGVGFAVLDDGSREPGVRGGLGTVWGAKRLKAMVLRPDQAVTMQQPHDFLAAAEGLLKSMAPRDKSCARPLDTPKVLEHLAQAEALPTRNFQNLGGNSEWLKAVEKISTAKRACIGCPFACVEVARIEQPGEDGPVPVELALFAEHLWALGPLVDVLSPGDSLSALKACQDYGLDPVSLGGVAAWASEFMDNGGKFPCDLGEQVGFGDGAWLASVAELVTTNSEMRDILGLGAYQAAAWTGSGTECPAMHNWGQEMTYVDPRRAYLPLSFLGPALESAANARLYEEETAPSENWADDLIAMEDQWALWETVGVCPKVAALPMDLAQSLPDFVKMATGLTITAEQVAGWGAKCLDLIKAFDWQEGWRPQDTKLAKRFFAESVSGPEKDYPALEKEAWLGRMEEYFVARGWEANGRPPRASAD